MSQALRTARGAWRDFRVCWPDLVATDLLIRVAAIVVLGPAMSLLFGIFLAGRADGVLRDTVILEFLLHPAGLLTLIVLAAVSLGLLFAEFSALMVIGFGASVDRRVSPLAALRYAFRRLVPFMHLAGLATSRLLLLVAPCLAGLGAIYWLLIGDYDINYYLAERPPEFLMAVYGALVLGVIMAVLVIYRVSSWLLAVPMVLFESAGGSEALRLSAAATIRERWPIAGLVCAWLLSLVLLSIVVTWGTGQLGDVLIPRGSSRIGLIAAGLGVVLIVGSLANLAVAVLSTTLFPLLVVRLYRSIRPTGQLGGAAEFVAANRLPVWLEIVFRRPLLVASTGMIVACFAVFLLLRSFDWNETAIVIAHRGGASVAPENTISAFERAIADGADWLEIDVQENGDGVVVVYHDSDFMRAARRDLSVWEATATDLDAIDIGSSFDPMFADQRVPTLAEVLVLARDRAGLVIELKYYGHDQRLEQKVVELVEQARMQDSVVIMSLDYAGLRKAAALRPDWTYGLLNTVSIGDLNRLDVDFLALNSAAASPSVIRRAHSQSIDVYAWTINDPVQMSILLSRNVDGIITDDVAMARQVLAVRAEITPLGRLLIWLAGETGLLRSEDAVSGRDDA